MAVSFTEKSSLRGSQALLEHSKFSVKYSQLTCCGLVTPYSDIDLDNMGSGYDLLPDGTMALPESMFIYH